MFFCYCITIGNWHHNYRTTYTTKTEGMLLLFEFSIATITNYHEFSNLILMCCLTVSVSQKYSVILPSSPLRVSQHQNQGCNRVVFSYWRLGEEAVSKLVKDCGRIQFLLKLCIWPPPSLSQQGRPSPSHVLNLCL